MKITFKLTDSQKNAAMEAAEFWARDGVVKVEFNNKGFILQNSANNRIELDEDALTYQGSRHAIFGGNSISDMLTAAGVLFWREEGEKSWLVANQEVKTSGYESWRTDANWWEIDLLPHLIGMERKRAGAEGRI